MKRIAIVAVLVLGLVPWAGPVQPVAAAQNVIPSSLDALYARVGTYWERLQVRDRAAAAALIRNPEVRARFIQRQEQRFFNLGIDSIDLEAFPERVTVHTSVDLMALEIGQTIRWPVSHDWVFEDGEWFLDLQEDTHPFTPTDPDPDANQRIAGAFRENFRVTTPEIRIPDDAFGQTLNGVIEYEYAGESVPVRLGVASGPEVVAVEARDLLEVGGPNGTIRFTILGSLLSTNALPDLILELRVGEEFVHVAVPVRWDGRPHYLLSFEPARIDEGYEGEIVLVIENLGEDVWTPGGASANKRFIESVAGAAPSVAPGESARYVFQTTSPQQADQETTLTAYIAETRILSVLLPYAAPETEATEDSEYTLDQIERFLPPR